MQESKDNNNNNKTAIKVVSLVLGMFLLAFASFPIYNLFCKITGYGGTPLTSDELTASKLQVGGRTINVRFNSDIMKDVPWKFSPLQKEVSVKTGENKLVFYTAENTSDSAVKGMATYNVTPAKASEYFFKVQCFCFNEQTLSANEKVEMPVSFYIDPEIENDPYMNDVKTITLSYTFFKATE
ncbi:MAG: cytochrome c oxidase assembly protein [Alphaproteobacteria bacterium CG11_big_fil_rev_8_21_14_0_20_39_49]|nr:MAG: cytochrome c oxidase assembly protein [Alphaproteobacteria bacterium CG11_big_fil_rev_8_21_14_0_20_39_49]